ncbi:MAG: diguanylate cyclase [Bacillota bacterium]|nr:diguanylate cyclase [Bacillota bacterium]
MKDRVNKLGDFLKLDELYDSISYINPITKRILELDNEKKVSRVKYCYNFWNRNERCTNCIAMRAYNEDKPQMKIDYNSQKIFMAFAQPIVVDSKKYVVEMYKDITNSGLVEDIENKNKEEIASIIKKMNEKDVIDRLTGINNERYVKEALPNDIHESNHGKKPLAIIKVCLESIDLIKDRHGHKAIEYLIFETADILMKTIGNNNGWVARCGNEEFFIVLRNTDSQVGVQDIEMIRKNIMDKKYYYDGNEIDIDINIALLINKGDYSSHNIIEVLNEQFNILKCL